MTRLILTALISIAACSGGSTPRTGPDAAPAPSPDAPRDAAACAPKLLYLEHNGGTYHAGNDDSRTNSSSILSMASTTIEPRPGTDWDVVKACVTAGLAGFPVTVTDVDPGTTPHVELVFTTTIPGINGPGVAPFACAAKPNAIAWISATHASGALSECGIALGLFGLVNGLEYTTSTDDFMSFQVCTSASCAFRNKDEKCGFNTPQPCMCGGGATENPASKLHAALCP